MAAGHYSAGRRSLKMMMACLLPGATSAFAQSAADDANKSNNPLNLSASFNVRNYYTPSIFSSSGHTNDFLLRPTIPMGPSKLIPVPQIFRVTVPVSTRPDPTGGYNTGLGDINIFDIFLLDPIGSTEIGLGPLLTIPTASDKTLGTGKWQAGLSAVAVNVSRQRLLGALIQWQHSFAGQSDRPAVQTLTAQPFIIWNLPDGWYLRSSGTWTFDLQSGSYYIPVGLGGGKAWKVGKTIFNAFIEPQYSIAHSGAVPRWQIFAGVNMSFGH